MVIVDPSALADGIASLGSLGTSLGEAHVVAELPITGILASAADEISPKITTLFNSDGQWYGQLASRAEAFLQEFTRTLAAASQAYQNTE
jgi:hypothetical protein